MTPRPGPGEVVDLLDGAEHRARLLRRDDHRFAAVDRRDAHHFGAFGGPRIPASRARARLDEAIQVEAQRVAVGRDGHGVHRRGLALGLPA